MKPTAHFLFGPYPKVVAVHPDGIESVTFNDQPADLIENNVYHYRALTPSPMGTAVTVEVVSRTGDRRTLDRDFWGPRRNAPTLWVSNDGSDVNGDGSETNPYQTIYKAASEGSKSDPLHKASGLTIRLKPGKYTWAGKTDAQANIRTEYGPIIIKGSHPDLVTITGNESRGSGLLCTRHHFVGITFNDVPSSKYGSAVFEDCKFMGRGTNDPTNYARQDYFPGGVIFSNCVFRDFLKGPIEPISMENCSLYNLGSDAFQQFNLVYQCYVEGIQKPAGSDAHPDVAQLWCPNGPVDNRLIYGLTANKVNSQGLFLEGSGLGSDTSISYVDVTIRAIGQYLSQISRPVNGFYMKNVRIFGQPFVVRTLTGRQPTILQGRIENCIFETTSIDPLSVAYCHINNCHFVGGHSGATGDNPTFGRLGPVVPGDANGDGVVDQADLDFVLANWGRTLHP